MDVYVYNGKALQYNGKCFAPKATGETWVLNDNLQGQYDDRELVSSIAFVSKNTLYSKIAVGPQVDRALRYNDNEVWAWKTGWLDQAYRTIAFLEAPTGELLTWLQSNGTKQ